VPGSDRKVDSAPDIVRFKICGIVSKEDALLAVASGADALGFLVGLDYPSDDEIAEEAAAEIIAVVPPFVSTVLVTHRVDTAWIVAAARTLGCSTIQLHGSFPIERIPDVRAALPYVKISRVAHVEDEGSLSVAASIGDWADAVHLDTRTATRLGGTGLVHDWRLSARIVRQSKVPVILAGGLTPQNVKQAIEVVRPYAVDVNSGVDLDGGPGKSAEKLRAFADAVRRAQSELSPIG